MKKISIVGRGTVGCIAVAHFLRYTDWYIDWVYDPTITPASVGEGTNLTLPRALALSMNFSSEDIELLGGTAKFGIWKRGWGPGKDFKHTFPAGSIGMHFSAVQFQEFMFEKFKLNPRVRLVEVNVEKYDDVDGEHVLVCTGTPKLNDEYVIRDSIPVNSAKVFQCPWDHFKFNYSLTFAKKNGWVFGIPLQKRCAIGYLYNKNFATESDIDEEVQDILQEFNLVPETTRNISFNNYCRKVNYYGRVSFTGNASFFLEPLEATSTGFAEKIIRKSFDIWHGNTDLEQANYQYHKEMEEYEAMICLHYMSGSIYNSDFWYYAKELGHKDIVDAIKNSPDFMLMLYKTVFRSFSYIHPDDGEVGSWPLRSYIQNVENLNIDKELGSILNLK